jgi:hypothetical protein
MKGGRMKSSRPSSDIAGQYLTETAAFPAKQYRLTSARSLPGCARNGTEPRSLKTLGQCRRHAMAVVSDRAERRLLSRNTSRPGLALLLLAREAAVVRCLGKSGPTGLTSDLWAPSRMRYQTGVWGTGWRLRLGAVHLDHCSGKGLRSLLRQVVSDAALDRPV